MQKIATKEWGHYCISEDEEEPLELAMERVWRSKDKESQTCLKRSFMGGSGENSED
jgi:hypothetical protein